MACALTQGYSLDCRDSMGGIDTVYFMEYDNVSGGTSVGITVAAGVVTAIVKKTGKRFWKYNLDRNLGSWEEAYQDSVENGTQYNTQTLSIVLNKMSSTVTQELKLLAQNRLVAVVKDKNGKYWFLGYESGLQRTGGKAGSGKAGGDRNGYELTFTADNREPAYEVNSAIVTGLETSG